MAQVTVRAAEQDGVTPLQVRVSYNLIAVRLNLCSLIDQSVSAKGSSERVDRALAAPERSDRGPQTEIVEFASLASNDSDELLTKLTAAMSGAVDSERRRFLRTYVEMTTLTRAGALLLLAEQRTGEATGEAVVSDDLAPAWRSVGTVIGDGKPLASRQPSVAFNMACFLSELHRADPTARIPKDLTAAFGTSTPLEAALAALVPFCTSAQRRAAAWSDPTLRTLREDKVHGPDFESVAGPKPAAADTVPPVSSSNGDIGKD